MAETLPPDLDSLKESAEFLNLLLDNITSAVLIVDEELRIHQFNRSFLSLFDRAADQLAGASFGPVAGCVNAVRENKACGATSQCRFCLLKQSLVGALADNAPVDRQRLERVFYIDGRPVSKHLEFSARRVQFQGRTMTLVIIYDITAIEEQRRALEEKQAQLEADLRAASEIQKSLLPQTALEIPGLRTAWRFEPCSHVGGDIFQIHASRPERVSAYVLDVCGHGVSAALVAVTVSQFLHSLHNRMLLTGRLFDPAAVVTRLDQAFPLARFDCFFTIVYLTLDLRTRVLSYSNAGHVPPLLLRADGRLEALSEHGPVIGAGMGSPPGEAQRQLGPGDRVFLYTDGLVDHFGPEGERLGKDLLRGALERLRSRPLGEAVAEVFREAERLRGEVTPQDDMSLLALELEG
jgi:sigma-B regulation protein RsbU (phosphoserine phosphatase)